MASIKYSAALSSDVTNISPPHLFDISLQLFYHTLPHKWKHTYCLHFVTVILSYPPPLMKTYPSSIYASKYWFSEPITSDKLISIFNLQFYTVPMISILTVQLWQHEPDLHCAQDFNRQVWKSQHGSVFSHS